MTIGARKPGVISERFSLPAPVWLFLNAPRQWVRWDDVVRIEEDPHHEHKDIPEGYTRVKLTLRHQEYAIFGEILTAKLGWPS